VPQAFTSGGGGGGSGTVTSVSSTNTGIAVATPTTTPTLTLATLDVIAADGPPAADWSNNSKKITSVANGTLAQDAAAFGQIPTALPPNGSASGDLAGTYPSPTVAAIHETSGPTKLTAGTITDGQFLKRSGSTLVSGAPVASVAATDTSIVVGGTATAPTIATGTLDVIAADHPPAANWSNNSKKITSLAVATASTDAASLANTLDQFGAPAASVSLNSHTITSLADGVNALDAATLEQAKRSGIRPAGALFETMPRYLVENNAGLLSSQRVSMVAIDIPSNVTVTSITFVSGTTALGTGTHQYFGLYDNNLNLLRATNDDTSTAWAASTAKTLNLTSTFTTTYNGVHYLAILVVATTVPTIISENISVSTVAALTPVVSGTSNTGVNSLQNPAAALSAVTVFPYAYIA
jgi:hypothetical protein